MSKILHCPLVVQRVALQPGHVDLVESLVSRAEACERQGEHTARPRFLSGGLRWQRGDAIP